MIRIEENFTYSPNSPGNGLQWGSAGAAHYFYAFYPAAGMESNYDFGADRTASSANFTFESTTSNGAPSASITAKVPAEQNVVKVGDEYKANMNYAYMYAKKKVDAGSTGAVELDFHPLVTTFEVSLKASSGDVPTQRLTRVELSSATTTLTGTYSATLSESGLTNEAFTPTSNSAQGKTISVTLPTVDGQAGVLLSTTEAVKFTLFALPTTQTDLTLTLYFANGEKRALALKNRATGAPITVGAGKKAYINNLGVPETIYYFDGQGPTGSFLHLGETRPHGYYVTSYKKTLDGTVTPVTWSAQYKEEGATEFSGSAPSWLTAFVPSVTGSTSSTGYEITVSQNSGTASGGSWFGQTTVGMNNSKANAIDLSMRDVFGNTISQSTANCYVVSAPGWYKIPCVYGNAIKEGSLNEIAYKNNNANHHTSKSFVRHDDQAIAGPWITKATSGTGVNKGNAINVNKAAVLWQDASGLVSNVSYEANYVYFYVDPSKICRGNTLLAAELSDNTVVWSWHIWVMDDLDNLRALEVTSNNKSIKFMKRDLGWCSAGASVPPRSVQVRLTQAETGRKVEFTITQQEGLATPGRNLLYQWGRKDPMLGAIWSSNTFNDYTAQNVDGFSVETIQGGVTLGYAIQHPNVFISNNQATVTGFTVTIMNNGSPTQKNDCQYSGWCKDLICNLWNANGKYAAYGYEDDDLVTKTVYDPCPVGYKIPNRCAFFAFIEHPTNAFAEPHIGTGPNTINGATTLGLSFNTNNGESLFFPPTTLREGADGNLRTSDGRVFLHTACLGNGYTRAYEVGTYTSVIYFQGADDLLYAVHASTSPSGYGLGVRPIADE